MGTTTSRAVAMKVIAAMVNTIAATVKAAATEPPPVLTSRPPQSLPRPPSRAACSSSELAFSELPAYFAAASPAKLCQVRIRMHRSTNPEFPTFHAILRPDSLLLTKPRQEEAPGRGIMRPD